MEWLLIMRTLHSILDPDFVDTVKTAVDMVKSKEAKFICKDIEKARKVGKPYKVLMWMGEDWKPLRETLEELTIKEISRVVVSKYEAILVECPNGDFSVYYKAPDKPSMWHVLNIWLSNASAKLGPIAYGMFGYSKENPETPSPTISRGDRVYVLPEEIKYAMQVVE